MPKRKRATPSEAVLAAIKEAQRQGRKLSAKEAQAFSEMRKRVRPPASSAKEVVVVASKDGTARFKFKGQKGPGSKQHPRWVEAAERERAYLTGEAKRQRQPPTRQAVAARRSTSLENTARIATLLDAYAHLGRSAAKAVAAELGMSPEHVRRVRNRLAKQT